MNQRYLLEPFTMQPSEPTDALNDIIFNLKHYDVEGISPADTRAKLNRIMSLALQQMAETSEKVYIYDEQEVSDYIDTILLNGSKLESTKLSSYPDFEDLQTTTRFADLIKERVSKSHFGSNNFDARELGHLRSNIEHSKSLRALRQAVKLIIGPLGLWREHAEVMEMLTPEQQAILHKDINDHIEALMLELEQANKISAERKKVIDEIVDSYDPDAQDIMLLRAIEKTKSTLSISDTEAAGIHGISRGKLNKLRSSTNEDSSEASTSALIRSLSDHNRFLAEHCISFRQDPHHSRYDEDSYVIQTFRESLNTAGFHLYVMDADHNLLASARNQHQFPNKDW